VAISGVHLREGTPLFEDFENFGKLHANLTRPVFLIFSPGIYQF
jgi:hypothetical protein